MLRYEALAFIAFGVAGLVLTLRDSGKPRNPEPSGWGLVRHVAVTAWLLSVLVRLTMRVW